MEKIRLGRTGLMVSRSGFGAIPIQRLDYDAARILLRRAYDEGINFFDTARFYTDSEEKIGHALADVRHNLVIATKTMAATAEAFNRDLETSLRDLKTDYIDIYQFHNPSFFPEEEGEVYQAALAARKAGKIRFISVTNHRLDLATRMARSGLFDTVQFPVSAIAAAEDFELVGLCGELDVGFIGMKGMAGGLIRSPEGTFALLRSYGNIVPIWGIQHVWELEQFLRLEADPPALTDELRKSIARDKEDLAGSFCRACGYCVPDCSAGIDIATAARMSLLLRRMNPATLVTDAQRANMERIRDCTSCGACAARCPYGLDTPAMLRREYDHYQEYLRDRLNDAQP